jgi:hypothetical protein
MATVERERPAQIIIAASLLVLQGIWGLLRALRAFRYLESAGHVDEPGFVLALASAIFLVAVLSIVCSIALFNLRAGAAVPAIIVTILFAILVEASERLIFGNLSAGLDLGAITSFLFTTVIVTLLVLARRSLRTTATQQ